MAKRKPKPASKPSAKRLIAPVVRIAVTAAFIFLIGQVAAASGRKRGEEDGCVKGVIEAVTNMTRGALTPPADQVREFCKGILK